MTFLKGLVLLGLDVVVGEVPTWAELTDVVGTAVAALWKGCSICESW